MPADGVDRAVVALARRQHAVVSLEELARAGLGRHAVAHRVRTGWLRPMFRGVYLVGPLETQHSRALAAAMALGDGALLSHHAAAVLWGLGPPAAGPIDVTVPGRKTRGRDGIRVHRSEIHPADAARRHGIPVTSPARTLIDLATHTTPRELDRAVNEAHVHRLVTDHCLNEQFSRYPHHRGTSALREAIRTDPAFTRSEAERRALELIRAARLAAPETNVEVSGWEVDLLWRERRLIVEIDGYAFYSSRRSFERDRRKDQELGAAGCRVLRITWRQIEREPTAVVATLAAALAA